MEDPRAMLAESHATFEELADAFDAAARALRAINVLAGAKADLAAFGPHMVTGAKVFAEITAMKPRLEALLQRLSNG